MTDTDTPRTTAPATEGRTLTEEQIAEIEKALRERHPTQLMALVNEDVPALLASHAALRDRLARVEERERGLREALRLQEVVDNHIEECDECQDEGGCELGFQLSGDAIAARRVMLATPTDGAAPPRHDEGETP